ncbi:MAG: hypothetical protein HW380_3947 [Magnetococcales bacterium]|nr:hypothetical protein [Magnetococcales bacterium]
MEKCLCLGCKEDFERRGNVPGQKYCSRPECQRERKRLWQKEKLHCDAEYRSNQVSAQGKWTTKNPGYWKQYRAANPGYTACNRRRQIMRNRQRKKSCKKRIAKMDE